MVTEGYMRCRPCRGPTPGSHRVHDYRCNLQCILRVVFKKHRFLQGFGPLGGTELHLGDVKKCGFFHSFCFAGRKKSSKIVSEDVFNINGANIGPTQAQDGPKMAQHRPNMAPRWPKTAQHRTKMAPRWPNLGPTWPQDGPT